MVHRLLDITEMTFKPDDLFPGISAGDLRSDGRGGPVPQFLSDGRLQLCFGGYLLVSPENVILVDTGVGDGKKRSREGWNGRTGAQFLTRLAAHGVEPDDIDVVYLTHLHADHVGWNTRWNGDRWVPTFPRARYLVTPTDLLWAQRGYQRDPAFNYGSYADSVEPLVDTGMLDKVNTPCDLTDRISAHAMPGHTPGSSIVLVRGKNDTMVLTGDLIHHPVQFRRPSLCSGFCVDSERSAQAREGLLTRIAAEGHILAPTHFPWGRLSIASDGFVFEQLGDNADGERFQDAPQVKDITTP